MKPEALHRNHLAALIEGDPSKAAELRLEFGPHDSAIAADFLRATVAVCLEYRFGPGAGLGAHPVDYDDLPVFMREIRAAGLGTEPPPDFLAVEAVVRALYGEVHLTEPLTPQARSAALYTILRRQVAAYRWIRTNPGIVIDRAQEVMKTWLLG